MKHHPIHEGISIKNIQSDSIQPKDYKIEWTNFHNDCRALAWRLTDIPNIKGIVAVSRGGMIPAGILCRELNIKLNETLCISSYQHQDRANAVSVIKEPLLAKKDLGKGWIVVDDLADTGQTFNYVRELLPKAHLAAVYSKPQGVPYIDTFVIQVSQDTWIYFPWEWETLYIPTQPVSTNS